MPRLLVQTLGSARRAWLTLGVLAALLLAVCGWRLAAQTLSNPLPLLSGQAVVNMSAPATNLTAPEANWRFYLMRIPSGAQTLAISFSGSEADTVLRAKRLSISGGWEYFAQQTGNTDSITITSPAAEDWLVGVYAYTPYTNGTLLATARLFNLHTLNRTPGRAELGVSEIATNRFYTLQRAVDLGSNTVWETVAQGIGAAVPDSLMDTNAPGGRAFYRVVEALTPPPGWDGDGDGVEDILELTLHRTSPRLMDTDGDGWPDGAELAEGTDPLAPASTPRVTVMAGNGASITLVRESLTVAPVSVILTRDLP